VGSRAAARARDRFLLLAHRRVEIPERTVELVFLRAARRGIAAGAVRTFLGPLAGRRAAFAFGAGARPGRALIAGAAVGRTARGAGPALVTGLPGRCGTPVAFAATVLAAGLRGAVVAAAAPIARLAAALLAAAHAALDRKSTRLNSSHVKISYAVFCLEKNTVQTPPNP